MLSQKFKVKLVSNLQEKTFPLITVKCDICQKISINIDNIDRYFVKTVIQLKNLKN